MFQNSGFGNSFDGGFSEGGFTKDDSAGPSGDKQKKSRYVNLVPITASSLAEMTPGDSSFTYLGTEISQVTVVGSIFSQKKNDMCNTYQLDDTFGLLTLKHWSSGEEELDTSEHQDLEVGKYVRVYGQLRCFQNEVVVNVLHIRLVKDINEINTHLLEFMKYKQHVSSKVKKTKPVNGIPSFAGDGNNTTAYGNFGLSNVQTQVSGLFY